MNVRAVFKCNFLHTHTCAHTQRLRRKRKYVCAQVGRFDLQNVVLSVCLDSRKRQIKRAADQTGNPLSGASAETVLAFCPAEVKKAQRERRTPKDPRIQNTDAKSLGFMLLRRSRCTNTCTKTLTTAHPGAVTHTRTHTQGTKLKLYKKEVRRGGN